MGRTLATFTQLVLQEIHMLHAIVDSLWLVKSGAVRADYDSLAQAISEQTSLSRRIAPSRRRDSLHHYGCRRGLSFRPCAVAGIDGAWSYDVSAYDNLLLKQPSCCWRLSV